MSAPAATLPEQIDDLVRCFESLPPEDRARVLKLVRNLSVLVALDALDTRALVDAPRRSAQA